MLFSLLVIVIRHVRASYTVIFYITIRAHTDGALPEAGGCPPIIDIETGRARTAGMLALAVAYHGG